MSMILEPRVAEARIDALAAEVAALKQDKAYLEARTLALQAEFARLQAAVDQAVKECRSFPIDNRLAFRIEGILSAAGEE